MVLRKIASIITNELDCTRVKVFALCKCEFRIWRAAELNELFA